MRLIRTDSIKIAPDRQRQEFNPDRLSYIQNSIERIGLLQPICVAEDGTLVYGERRLKCLTALHMLGSPILFGGEPLPQDMVPALLPNETDEIARYEQELEENVAREDLTWQEQAQATARLKTLREMQAQVAQAPRPTVADIAEEVTGRRDGAYQAQTRKALIVAQHMNNPDVAKAKSVDDAFKILKRQETARQNTERAEGVVNASVGDRLQAVQADCLDWGWSYLEAGGTPFDVICTDPPYGMSAENFGDGGGAYVGIDHQYSDDRTSWLDLMNRFAQLAFAITKPDAHLYLCCDIDGFGDLKRILSEAGWRVHRTPLINYKRDANRVPWPSQGPRRCYELVLYAVKGSKPTNAIYPDVFESSGDDNLGHGAQKPVAFWLDLLRRSARPGDRVLDAFAGTGGILVAANELKLYCTAVEREAQYFGICLQRLEEMK